MADSPMQPIEALRVGAIELPHAQGEIRQGSFDQQMVMIVHQAIGMAAPSKSVDHMGESRQKGLPIDIGAHDLLPGIAPARDMIDRVRKFQP
jgi:hypothetical protein